MFSIVSTVSKSFPDLLSFWTRWESRDDNSDIRRSTTTGPEQKNSRASSPLSRWTPIPKSDDATSKVDEHDKKLNHAGWKSETVLADVEAKNSFTRAVASSGPPAETVSLLSFRSSNRNIDYLTRNEHTVSTQSVCQQETQAKEKTDIRHNDDNAGTRRKKTDRHSVVSDSRMLKKSPTFDSPTLNTRRIYKNKALKDSDERFSARRKHFKPKSESDNEMALAKKPINTRATNSATKGIENDATTSAIERHRPLSVSQQSLVAYDDENVFTENVRSERSLSLPAVPQSIVRIENSSHVYVNTSGSTGASAGVTEKRLSSGSNPFRSPKSISSGDSISYSVRNDVAELTKHILEEHENSQASVVTKRFEEARKFLQENPFLILTGHDGEGLTTLGYDLLLDYPEREQFIVMERKEALPCMTQSTDKQVIVFADDVFGTTYFDEKRYESWCRNMSQLQKLIKRNKAILILAIHLKFMKASQCKVFCDYYQDNMLNVSKPRLQLDFKERNKILLCNITSQMDLLHIEICRTKQEETTTKDAGETGRKCVKLSEQTIDDIARMSLSSGFPGKVAHFLKNVDNIKQGVHFFIMPTPEMFEEIDSFRTSKAEEDFQIYLALVAVFVYGSLNFDTFEIHCQYLAKSEKALRNYLATCSGKSQRLGQRTKCPDMINVLTGFAKKFKLLTELAGSVKKGVFLMLGRYLNEKDHMKGHYSVSSVSVERAVAISCAKEYPIDICKYSSKHIFNAVIDPDNAFEKKEMHISLREKDKDVCLAVMERLQLIQLPNKLLEFIQHPAMRVAWFAKLFIKHVKKSKHALKTMIMECDDKSGASLLSLSLKYPYIAPGAFNTQCFAEDLMLSGKWPKIRKENPIFAKEKEQELLEKCCEMGWTESYFRLVEKLQLLPTKACLSLTITSGNIDILTDLSRNMSLTKDDWYLALQRACKKLEENDRETMKIILFISKDIVPFEYQSQKIESIMHSAARSGDDVLLSKVISFYNDKNLKNRQGLTCLHLATQGNHHFCVQLALDNDVSQRVPDPKGELPLHYACRLGFTEITKLLVERDSDVVHRVSNSRSTPLHLSAENGHFEITKFLVINGAKLNTVDKKGRTPAYCAARFSTGIILDYLLENEIDGSLKVPTQTAVTERTGNTVKLSKHSRKQKITVRKQNLLDDCLIDVMREQCPESEKIDGIRHLLRMEANLNYVKEDVLPLLQLGIECRCSGNIIDFLLRNGVSVCQRDLQTGDNALHKAVKHGNKEIIQLILGNKTNIENLLRQRNKENETPLHIAVDSGSATLVKLLKTESTTKDFVVKQGRCLTPLALAEEKRDHSSDRSGRRKYEEVIKILSQSRS